MCINLDQHLPAITVIVEMEKVGFIGECALRNTDLDKRNLDEPNNESKRKKNVFVNQIATFIVKPKLLQCICFEVSSCVHWPFSH